MIIFHQAEINIISIVDFINHLHSSIFCFNPMFNQINMMLCKSRNCLCTSPKLQEEEVFNISTKVNDNDKKLLQWHPAFYAGLQIEFREEADKLIFEREHNLSTKPMQIDVLIIKKCSNDVINKNIGRIFRRYNIIEYKSPTDYLSIDDFYKVYGYTCFYKSDSKLVDDIKITDVTITFVCKRYPEKLVSHLMKTRALGIEKIGAGIYYICKDIVPIQILVTSELSEDENLWLGSMRDDIQSIDTIEKLSKEYGIHEQDELYKSMMNIIIRANKDKFVEVRSMCEALRELFADELEACRDDGIRCMIISSKEFGVTREQVYGVLLKNYEIDEEQAKRYIEQYW